jgi:hypothetical protein
MQPHPISTSVKLWYGAVAFLCGGVLVSLTAMSGPVAAPGGTEAAGTWGNTVCLQVGESAPDAGVWVDIGSPGIALHRHGVVPLGVGGNSRRCSLHLDSQSPLLIQAYPVTVSNVRGQHATSADLASEVLSVRLGGTGAVRACVEVGAGASGRATVRQVECRAEDPS